MSKILTKTQFNHRFIETELRTLCRLGHIHSIRILATEDEKYTLGIRVWARGEEVEEGLMLNQKHEVRLWGSLNTLRGYLQDICPNLAEVTLTMDAVLQV
jgi:hypothetical protein